MNNNKNELVKEYIWAIDKLKNIFGGGYIVFETFNWDTELAVYYVNKKTNKICGTILECVGRFPNSMGYVSQKYSLNSNKKDINKIIKNFKNIHEQ